MKRKVIILCHMFSGSYLNDNIGHEIINLYHADNGKQYIYLTADGKWGHNAKYDVVRILLVTKAATNILEIIGFTEGDVRYIDKYKIEQKTIRYADVPIEKIFRRNISQQKICVTFEVEKIVRFNTPRYIANTVDAYEKFVSNFEGKNKKSVLLLKDFNYSRNLREIIKEGDEEYNSIEMILESYNKKDLFENKKISRRDYSVDIKVAAAEIYGIIDKEVPFSNAFSYFFRKYPSLLRIFNWSKGEKLEEVVREKEGIDIFIRTNKRLIAIENKIFSGINSKYKKSSSKNQLTDYKRFLEKLVKGKDERYKGLSTSYFIIKADHNPLSTNIQGWTVLNYSKLAGVLENVAKKRSNNDLLKDFIRSLKIHCVGNYNYVMMRNRFFRKLDRLNDRL